MFRLIILFIFFAFSFLTIVRAPTNGLWYVSIAVTEFPLLFISIVLLLLFIPFGSGRYVWLANFFGVAAIVLYAVPIISAYRISATLNKEMEKAFGQQQTAVEEESPFRLAQMVTGIGTAEVPYQTMPYSRNGQHPLTLDFYPAKAKGNRPCVVVIHGGSWAGGNSRQLPELNSYLAKKGYHVAAINYRLAPGATFPAPVQDVYAALQYLRNHNEALQIDTANFILLGRSAGAQIALVAAYENNLPGIKGVISFYGPADMVWGYGNPASPLVMDSRKVMETYFNGTYDQKKQLYVNSSPVEIVDVKSPPTLLIHGQNDPLVAYGHSTRLSPILKNKGVPHYLLSMPWATHGLDYTLNGPGGQLSAFAVEKFIQFVTKK